VAFFAQLGLRWFSTQEDCWTIEIEIVQSLFIMQLPRRRTLIPMRLLTQVASWLIVSFFWHFAQLPVLAQNAPVDTNQVSSSPRPDALNTSTASDSGSKMSNASTSPKPDALNTSIVPDSGGKLSSKEQIESEGYFSSSLLPISLAFVVGVCGAWCFYSGVRYGLIDRTSRKAILQHLPDKEIPLLFCFLGGIVAAVFQAAQPHVFAPIQAFVLGATWPSVVTRIMSGSGSGSGLTEMDPRDIKPPAGNKAVAEPEVVMKA
jgi:hypothetical protein